MMRKLLFFVLILLNSSIAFSQASDLFISEYIEGSSYNKAIEIFNGTGAAVDLSEYSLEKDVNGNGVFGNTYNYSGTLEIDDVFVLANSQADAAILNVADDTNNGVINFNGNDQIVLLKNGVIIDHLGYLGGDDFAIDVTLIRNPEVISPTTAYNESEWEELPQNSFDNLGFHVFEGTNDPTIIVTSPNGGEEWEQDSAHSITWTTMNFDADIKIELEQVYNRDREVLVASTENDGVWEWNIPADQLLSEFYVIVISDAEDGEPWDESDNSFSIIEPIPITPYTIYEIQYSTTGPSPHVGELVITQGVVTAIFENYFFIQDGAGAWNGIAVYPMQDVILGHLIEITAYVAEYNEKTELTDIVQITDLGLSEMPQAEIITAAQLASSEEYECVLACVEGVTVTNEDLGYGNWEVSDQSGSCIIGGLGDYTYVPAQDDYIYSITGVVDLSYGSFKLEPRDDNDLNVFGLEALPNRLLFLTFEQLDGQNFTIYNLSNESIIINNITSGGDFPPSLAGWGIEDFNINFPYELEAQSSNTFTIYIATPVIQREIITDTIFIETDDEIRKISLFFNSELVVEAEDQSIEKPEFTIQNFPNPFNPSTTISFENINLTSTSDVRIEIYNIKGQNLKTFKRSELSNSSVTWNAEEQASGVYFYKLIVNEKVAASKKMLLLK